MSDRLTARLDADETPVMSLREPVMTGTNRELVSQKVIGNKVKKTYKTEGTFGHVDLMVTDRRLLRTGLRPSGRDFMDKPVWNLDTSRVAAWPFASLEVFELTGEGDKGRLRVIPWAGRASSVRLSARERKALEPVARDFAAGKWAPDEGEVAELSARRSKWQGARDKEHTLAARARKLWSGVPGMGCGTLVFLWISGSCLGYPLASILGDLANLRFPSLSLYMLPGLVLGGLFGFVGLLALGTFLKDLILGLLAVVQLPGVRGQREGLER